MDGGDNWVDTSHRRRRKLPVEDQCVKIPLQSFANSTSKFLDLRGDAPVELDR